MPLIYLWCLWLALSVCSPPRRRACLKAAKTCMKMGCWTFWAVLFVSKKRRVAADPSRPAAGAIDLAQAEAAPPAASHTAAPAPTPAVGTSATVQEKLADLQHPDAEHLLLGINLEGLREACELIGFPYRQYKDGFKMDGRKITYKREDHPEMAWLDEVYPTNYMSDK